MLEFDSRAALEAAGVVAARQKSGRPLEMRDAQIAGIALARKASIATRNVGHFEDVKVPIVNPWSVS